MADTSNEGGAFFEKYGTPLALLVGLIVIAGAVYFGRGATAPDTTGGDEVTAQAVDIDKVKTEGNPYVGNKNAPVTMAVWYDFQCHYCKDFEAQTLESVRTDYVNNGKVKIVFKDFPILGQASLDTAVYSRALWEAYPDKWPAWFHAVMAGDGEVTLDAAGLDALATSLGMDAARINKLVTDKGGEYMTAVQADHTEGQSFGIRGTPGSIIGTTFVNGAHPYTPTGRNGEIPVKPLIEAELAK